MSIDCKFWFLPTGYHRRLNVMIGMKPNIWKLISALHQECGNFSDNLMQMKLGQTSRVSLTKYVKINKMLTKAFDKFDKKQDVKYLLRFAGNQATNLNIEPVEHNCVDY